MVFERIFQLKEIPSIEESSGLLLYDIFALRI